jgi:hypothetical protein
MDMEQQAVRVDSAVEGGGEMSVVAIKEKPILFRGPMVNAILDGGKTQTRRIVKPQPVVRGGWHDLPRYSASSEKAFREGAPFFGRCPYGSVGDRLWVREAWAANAFLNRTKPSDLKGETIYHRATYDNDSHFMWRPSIHMPRWACRLVLEITDVRVERLNAITPEDAVAEGIEGDAEGRWKHYLKPKFGPSPVHSFQTLWESINGVGSWAQNPWVWVVSFRRIER